MRPFSNSDFLAAFDKGWSLVDLRRDRDAFDRWATNITPYLKCLTRDLAGHRRVAWDLQDEIVNETFARIWSGSDLPHRSVAGWLRNQVRSAANAVLGTYGLRRRPDVRSPALGRLRDGIDVRAEDPSETVPDRMVLQAVLDTLPDVDRDLLIRAHVFGESLGAIGASLGVSKPTAHRRVLAATARARSLAGCVAA
jgi:DNA-directed RNA polymerase specialized sigma24 family protein